MTTKFYTGALAALLIAGSVGLSIAQGGGAGVTEVVLGCGGVLSQQRCALGLEGDRNVFKKDQTQGDMLVVGRLQVLTQLVGSQEHLRLETEIGAIAFVDRVPSAVGFLSPRAIKCPPGPISYVPLTKTAGRKQGAGAARRPTLTRLEAAAKEANHRGGREFLRAAFKRVRGAEVTRGRPRNSPTKTAK